MPENNLESLYAEAQQALKVKDNDRASNLLKQILVIDENYKDTSRLLARIVKEKRRRWYNDLRTWGTLGVLLLAGLVIFIASRFSSFSAARPSSTPVAAPTTTSTAMVTTDPTQALLPVPTVLPPAWKRISMGQEFIRDTVTAIVVDPRDPDVIYVGMQSAGIFKSIDGGNSWSPILEGLENAQVRALLIDPQAPDSLIAGTAGGVFKSINGGSSWQWVAEYGVQELLMDPQNSSHLYLGDGHLVYETTDGGGYWAMVSNDQTCPSKSGYYNSLEIDPRNGEFLYITTAGPAESVGGCQGVYRSANRGRTWTRLGLNSASDMAILQDERDRTTFMVSGSMAGGGKNAEGLYVSMNEGQDWKFVQSYQCAVMTTSSNYTDQLYCGVKTGGFYKTSSMGGARASGLSADQVTAIYADNYNGQERIIVGVEKNGLFISTDGGKSWSNQFGGLGATYLSLTVGKADGTRLYVNSQYGDYGCVLYRSDDRGSTWKLVTDIISEHYGTRISTCIPAIDPDDTLYAFPKMGLAKSHDGGETWENIQIPPSEGQAYETRYIAANPYAAGPIYFITSSSHQIFLSFDSGKSWQASGSSPFDHWGPRLFFAGDGQVVYFGNSNGRRQVSNDAGQTWSACAGETAVNANSDSYLAIDPRNPGRLIYATSGNGIESSTDGCKSWQTANIGLTSRFFNSVAIDPNQPDSFYAGSDGGAYMSLNGGETWSQINDGLLGATVVYSIVVDKDSNIYAATPYGIFKLESK